MSVATSDRFDILVVGAGAAGLAAAGELTRAGARVAVLEARSAPGGRIRTLSLPGWDLPVELGAEFVHGRSAPVFRASDAAGLALLRIPERHAERIGSRLRPLQRPWERYHALTSRIPRGGADRSVADFLAHAGKRWTAEDRRLLAALVEGYDAAPLETASARALSTKGEPGIEDDDRAQFRPATGYAPLIRGLIARIDPARGKILFSTPATRIRWRRGRVEIASPRGAFRARRALITVPVGVLKGPTGARGGIAFEPEPPALQKALSGLAMGDVVKLVLRFARPLWRDARRIDGVAARFGGEPPVFLHLPGARFPTWWTAAPFESSILTAWSGGPQATELRRLSTRRIVEAAISEIAAALGLRRPRVASALLDWQFHDWTGDPYARGAYSHVVVGGSDAARLLARPIAGTLYFAGEAASDEESGTVGAALESGRQAARRLLR